MTRRYIWIAADLMLAIGVYAAWLAPLWVFIPLALLAGCSGTQLTMDGEVCGQPIHLTVADKKDRSGFAAHVECPGGGSMDLTSSDSSTSAYVKTLVDGLVGMADKLAAAAPKP